MKKLRVLSGILLMMAALPLAADAVPAPPVMPPLVFTLDEYAGTNSQVILNVIGMGTHSVNVDVSLGGGTVADIRAVYFSYQGNLTGVSLTGGADLTSWKYKNAGGIETLGGDTTLHGDGNIHFFNGGVVIGTPGIGKDDISSTHFTLTANENITFTDFGARLTSVGIDRSGSSKLYVKVDTGTGDLGGQGGPVPEPASVALIGIGAVFVRAIQGRGHRV
jgi:hypothetical protein